MAVAANFEVDIVENVEQFAGPLLDLSQVDDHIVGIDRDVQSQHVLQGLLGAAEPLKGIVDEDLQLVEYSRHLGQLGAGLLQVVLDLRLLRLPRNTTPRKPSLEVAPNTLAKSL